LAGFFVWRFEVEFDKIFTTAFCYFPNTQKHL
jgi:hypothetical protein